ncbi:MAG TPA: glycosyltransferase, partial [Thermoanaerobaculia bacterium]|nr:glycosyltransferase [Thermoanaerobaculia bacterium]
LIDSLGLSFRRRAAVDRPWRRWLWRAEAARLERWEREMVRRATVSWVVSERDRDHLVAGRPALAHSTLRVLPPGVEPGDPPAEGPAADSAPLLAVTGNLGYFATAEGLRWWLEEVWPLARARHQGLRLLLAGARPPAWLLRRRHPAVTVARDPADLRPLLAAATVAVVPARAGAGVPMKILEAWAAGVPVIAHPWSAAGAGAVPGEDLLTAETPPEWLAALARLLGSPAERRRLAAGGREHLRAAYAPAELAARLRDTVRALA